MTAGPLCLSANTTAAAVALLPVVRAVRSVFPARELRLYLKDVSATLYAFEPGVSVLPYAHLSKKGKDAKDLTVFPLPTDSREELSFLVPQLEEALGAPLTDVVAAQSHVPLLSDRDREEAGEKMGPKSGCWLGLSPFSRSERRSPAIQRWEKFFAHVTRTSPVDRYFLFGIPSDYKRLQRLRLAATEPDKVECVFPSTFRTMTAYLARLNGLITIDSGALPLARAVGLPTMGWFQQGVFQRFPTSIELSWAFDKWHVAMLE